MTAPGLAAPALVAPGLAQLTPIAPYTWLLVPGLVLVIASLFFSIRNRKKRNQNDPSLSAAEQIERNRNLRGMRGDLEQIMVEIEQMAKRVGHQLDAKAIRLEHLLDQADLKIAQLQHLHERHDTTDHSSPPPPAQAPQAEAPRPAISTAPGNDQPHPAPPAAPSPDSPNHQTHTPPDPPTLHQKVYALADAGQNPDQIALELNEMPGTVELILNLRQA